MDIVAAIALIAWLAILALPVQPWRYRERLTEASAQCDLTNVTVIIPARNEAESIGRTLDGVLAQGELGGVVVVDDQSDDDTRGRVAGFADRGVELVPGSTPPPGWTGKLWALEQGVRHAGTALLLLLDADVELSRGALAALEERRAAERADLASVMVRLTMASTWERLLLPAFVYFFKLLYPFRLANRPGHRLAAAAGGMVLLRRDALEDIGGFSALHDALIDDCALARACKRRGRRVWIGTTHLAVSRRRYPGLADIDAMVTRTAFTQLRYSWTLLALCTLIMTVLFAVPLIWPLLGDGTFLGFGAHLCMIASYVPTLVYYKLNPTLAVLLPLIGMVYLIMTWRSALRHQRGTRSAWRGRIYAS